MTSKKQQLTSQTRRFIERISCDATLQKNDNCRRLYKSPNPILEDLLEAEERVIAHVRNVDEERQEGIKQIESQLKGLDESDSLDLRLRPTETSRKSATVSLMQGSLSRDQADHLSSKM